MGNNGSSARDQQHQVASSVRSSGLPGSETSRGWSQSFPRELAKHRSQPPTARKVLPEPPNQRLRATDNGCIIHNGGTISGRKPTTFPSSRELDKYDGPFRGRSVTMSNIGGEPRPRRVDRRRCCRYRADAGRAEIASSELKRFDSEPDLRYSPDTGLPIQDRSNLGKPNDSGEREDERSSSYRRLERETKDRGESRYKARKKYKAPAPPSLLELGIDSQTPLDPSYARNLEPRCRIERELQPPPRRSRLFKTRAETKKARIGWHLSEFNRSFAYRDREPVSEDRMDVERKDERDRRRDARDHSDNEISNDAERQERDRIRRTSEYHRQRSKLFDGKNTLQRSMSSPEFQAELIQAARRVRDKLECTRRTIGESSTDLRSLDRRADDSDKRNVDRVERSSAIACPEQFVQDRGSPKVPNRGGNWRKERANGDEGAEADAKLEGGEKSTCLDREEPRHPSRERLERVTDAEHGRRANEIGKYADPIEITADEIDRNALDTPMARFVKDAIEIRGWYVGRAGTPDHLQRRIREKDTCDPGWWNDDFDSQSRDRVVKEECLDIRESRKSESKFGDSTSGEALTSKERRREDGQPFVSTAQSAPKTFYFGMNEILTSELVTNANRRKQESRSKFRDGEDGRSSVDTIQDTDDNGRSVIEDISLKLRPTLPKKQLEIPRFSPSAAWRLLSALEASGPSMSTASEEMPVMFEERIERLSRPPPPPPPPPPPLLALGPRSLHDKSGDSGISGDAGAANDDSLDVSTINRMKRAATRPTWTPQQDLGEESSSDAGVDSPPPLPASLKYPPRAHVFSLSLPRDDARTYLCSPEAKLKEGSAFNSLKKLKRSVSGAFGIGGHDVERKRGHDILDDNWLLSTSAPTSLQHNQLVEATRISSAAWKSFVARDRVVRREQGNVDATRIASQSDSHSGNNDRRYRSHRDDDDDDDVDDDDHDGDEDADDDDDDDNGDSDDDDDDDDDDEDNDEEDDIATDERRLGETDSDNEVVDNEAKEDFPAIMKPPSFSYLAPGGHVMYLPESNEAEHRVQSLNGRNAVARRNFAKETKNCAESGFFRSKEDAISTKRRFEGSRSYTAVKNSRGTSGEFSSFGESYRKQTDAAKQRRDSPARDQENLPPNKEASSESKETKSRAKSNSKGRRFTFQSTVRQIERRRLAEKLSKEAEAKERQRRGEMEAMRKVEEEFQRKRAKEKANIRQQLRLFKEMEENLNNLPIVEWDGSQLSRADPDGAPSSTTSSPTSLPADKLPATAFAKILPSDECRPGERKEDVDSRSGSGSALNSKQRRDESKNRRPKYYDWAPESSSQLEYKQTTVHPKIVYDIPKSSPVFVDVNVHPVKPPTSNSTPRSENYRKDFAHGTLAELAKSSFASSDSELSQPNTTSHSRQTEIKGKQHRSRSASLERSEDAATSEEDLPLNPAKWSRKSLAHGFMLNSVQPFTKDRPKTYRPISFNPQPPQPIPS